jgi:hypothetical protein
VEEAVVLRVAEITEVQVVEMLNTVMGLVVVGYLVKVILVALPYLGQAQQ